MIILEIIEIWEVTLTAKTFKKCRTLDFQNCEKILKKLICIRKNQRIDFIWKEGRFLDFSRKNCFFLQFFYNFLPLLLCKMNILSIFRIVGFFWIFILLESIRNSLWMPLSAGNVYVNFIYKETRRLKIWHYLLKKFYLARFSTFFKVSSSNLLVNKYTFWKKGVL